MEVIEGPLVTLYPLQESLIPPYLNQFSKPIQNILCVSSKEEEENYLHSKLQYMQNNFHFFYCIFDNHISQLIGAIEIRDYCASRGQLYCWLHQNFWGSGRFSDAMLLAASVYFQVTGYMFFNAYVDQSNKRSYTALKKIGFADLGLINGARGKQYELVLRKQ